MRFERLFTFSFVSAAISPLKLILINRFSGLFFLLLFCFSSIAEGTKELRPTASDFGSLQIYDRGRLFATYNAPAMDRLYVHICSPGEIIYFGFKQPDNDVFFRLKDPSGNIVPAYTSQPVPNSGAGYIATYNQAVTGPAQIAGAGGYNAMSYTALVAGDYYFEFNTGSATTPPANPANGNAQRFFDLLDITVASGAVAKPGRLWSYSWDINTTATNNPFTGKMYILSTDSIVTSIDFNGMQPFGAVIAANSTGLSNTGNLVTDRKSKVGNFSVPEYKIFLNDPDRNCYPTGSFGNIIGQPIVTGCDPATRCINIAVNKPGKVEIVLDLNGTAGYQPNTTDLLIIADVVAGQNCIPWDSKDGLGNYVTAITGIPLEISYLNGVTHLPLYDVEANPNGYIVELIRPAGAKPNLYWDDSAINKGTAPDGKVNLTGCSNAGGCHKWKDRGDNASAETINTWWYPNIITRNLIFDIPAATVDADNRNITGELNDSLVCESISSFKLSGVVEGTTLGGSWTGGAGTFLPSRNVVNPTYVPNQAERNAGSVKLYLTSTTNGICPPAKDSVIILFEKAPVIKTDADKTICSTTKTIPVNAILTNAATGIWKGGTGTFTVPTNKSAVYTVSSADTTAGSIDLIFTSTGMRLCAQEDDTIHLSFERPPVVRLAADKIICALNNTLPVSAALVNGATGIWTGGNGSFATASALSTNYFIAPADITAGNINLIFTSTGVRTCPQQDDTISITLHKPVSLEVGPPMTICEGITTVNIHAAGDNTAALSWTGGNGSFSNSNGLTTTYTLAPAEIHASHIDLTLTGKRGVCPDSSDVLSIIITPIPSVDAGKDTLICKATNFTRTGSGSSGAAFKWYSIPSQTILATQNSITLQNLQTAGDYVLEASSANNCSNTDTISIQVYELPTLNPGGPFCFEPGLTLHANAAGIPAVSATYIWQSGNNVLQSDPIHSDLIVSTSGDYTLTYKTAGCSKDALVTVKPKPILSTPEHELFSCEGSTITLLTNPRAGSAYTWRDKNGTVLQNSYMATVFSTTDAETYVVTETDANGCSNKDSIIATGTPIPQIVTTDAAICADSSAALDVTTTNIPAHLLASLQYEWRQNSQIISMDKTHNTSAPGIYNVKVSLGTCSSDKNIQVTVHELPVPTLPASYVFCSDNGNTVTLDAGAFNSYKWSSANETSQTITVNHAGIYDVLITNASNCKAQASTSVTEICKPALFVSNAFSPNGDGINDTYDVFDSHVGAYSMTIFNRWGEVIFHSTDKTVYWDGTYKGNSMPVGVYPYVIKYEGDSEQYKGPFQLEGSVTIVK